MLLKDKKQGAVYSVRYENCEGGYIREFERHLSTRIKEYKDSVLKGNEKSALSSRNLETQEHTFDWDHVAVVDTAARKYYWKVSQAIPIDSGMQS